jgi:hypothetical protein
MSLSLHYVRLSCFVLLGMVLFSCNQNENKTNTETVTNDTTTAAVSTSRDSVSSIVTGPQLMMIVRHRISNYDKWKMSYDAHDSMRLANALHNYVIGRSADDSNMLLVAVKADDAAKAKAFSKDPDLKKAMQKGGVTGNPSISMVNVVWQDTASLQGLRSLTTFTVKDWETWQRSFLEGRSERLANGITDRLYGHDPDNQNKVSLVTAITDSAKAAAYWTSDMLKKRRQASGVIGQPERFLFHIAQRY